jgi:amino acid adenylation domain-containing protein
VSESPLSAAFEGFSLSPQQARVWRLLPAAEEGAFRASCAVVLEGELDAARLRKALERMVERHEMLRTAFRCLPGMTVPLQVVGAGSLVWEERSGNGLQDAEAAAEALSVAPGETAGGSPLRAVLSPLAPDRHLLVLSLPALCADRRSLSRLPGEIGRGWSTQVDGPPMQYADFAGWQNEILDAPETAEEREFWRRQDLAPHLEAGTPGERFAPRHTRAVEIGAAPSASSPAAFLLACWQVLLARLTGEPELVIGVGCDGREYEELEEVLGPVEKVLPVAGRVDPAERFAQVVRRAARSVEQVRAHQNAFSWERLAEWSEKPDALLAVRYAFSFEEEGTSVEVPGLRLRPLRAEAAAEIFKLRIEGTADLGGSLRVRLAYDASRCTAEEAERLAGWFAGLARRAAAAPDTLCGGLDPLSEAERRRELIGRNDTAVDLGARCLHDLVAAQARNTPDRVAVRAEEGTLTHAALWAAAGRIAGRLHALGVGRDVPVAIHAERSLEMVAGLLGILRAGGCYVPLDPDHPAERLSGILAEVRPRAILSQAHLADRLPPADVRTDVPRIVLAEAAAPGEPGGSPEIPEGIPEGSADLDSLAYAIFTSGSTGRPKGVMVPHRAIVNRLLWMQRELPLEANDRVLQKTPFGFDASIWEIFCPLLAGAELVLARPGGHQDSSYLARAAAGFGITVLQLVPSQLRPFLEEPEVVACASLRRVFCGGEELPADLERRLATLLPGAVLHNLYGPTEVAIDATFWVCREPTVGRSVPIGHPLANVQVYLLAPGGQPTLPGAPGELYVGGTGVARGYMGRPDLTAERFVPDSFSGAPGARLYRTGDLVRRRSGGEIEYLRRADRQLKIRGVRIEPHEIEAVLAGCAGVRQAIVAAVPDPEGDATHLSAYVVAADGEAPTAADLRRRLAEALPAAMIPSVLGVVRSLPLTPNGKLDLRALEAAALAASREERAAVYEAPRTPTEQLLAEIWADVLETGRPPGLSENFFDLGGHSLRATQLVSRVRRVFQIELSVRDLFERPTVQSLAARLDDLLRGGEGTAAPRLEPVPRDGRRLVLSFAQQRLWFLDRLQPGSSFYNIPTAIRFLGRLDRAALERSLGEIVRRHEVLRTVFREGEDGEPEQVVGSSGPVTLPLADLSGLPPAALAAEADRQVAAEIARPFDLETGPLFRALLLRLGEEAHVGVLSMHHITSDGWSTAVLVREVAALYPAFAEGRPSPLAELPIQYADFASWQRHWLRGDLLESQIGWWRERLAGAPPILALPTDRPRPAVQTFRGGSEARPLAADLAGGLRELARREGASLFMVLVAAGAVLLRWWSGQEDLVIGTDVANRNRHETEGLIGFFINQLALRTRLVGDPSFREVLEQVRGEALGAYAHEDLPFDQLVLALNPERSRKHSPLFQVKVNLHNIPTPDLELPELRIEPLRLVRDTAQFDLIVNFMEAPPGMIVSADFANDLFDARTIARLLADLEILLAAVAGRPDARLGELCDALSKADRELRQAEQSERRQVRARTLKQVRREAVSVPAGGDDGNA